MARGHGIALYSGGLDSTLAILLILQQEIEVTALTFLTPFGCDADDSSGCSRNPSSLSARFGFKAKMMHLGQEFVDLVRNPKYGHGRNMNPCIDCRILMLREARKFMEMVGADFVFTGEVLGQRPMSQYRPQLHVVARDSDLKGRLVRPLSARLLPPTEPEISGLLDRERLEAISGRSRKRQMELAASFGLEDYPSPAGGCLLTDPVYSNRLRDLFAHQENIDFNDLNLLRVGRHFRLDEHTKVIVGRNEGENDRILKYRCPADLIFEAVNTGSPLTLIKGDPSVANITRAAVITARYCDLKKSDSVEISYYSDPDKRNSIRVAPATDTMLNSIRIE